MTRPIGWIKRTAYKEKDRAPYAVTLGSNHLRVLEFIAQRGANMGCTDRQITFGCEMHMAAARRCELRDVGAVRRAGRYRNSWCWKLTDKGQELLEELREFTNKEQAA